MRRAKPLLVSLVIMLLSALPAAAFAKAEDDATIKIVPQYLPYGGIEVAAWTPDDLNIITAAGTSRTVLIWDVAKKVIVNRLSLPAEPSILKRRFAGITVAKDGRSAAITGQALKRDGAATFVRYRIDLESLRIEAQAIPKNEARKAVWGKEQESAILALEILFERVHLERDTAMTMDQATKLMPELPYSHAGGRRLVRMYNYQDPVEGQGVGLAVWPPEGSTEEISWMETSPRGTNRMALSRDGTKLAFVNYSPSRDFHAAINRGAMESSVSVMDLQTGSSSKTLFIGDNYRDVQWIDGDTLSLVKQAGADGAHASSLLVSYAGRKPKTMPLGVNCHQVTNGQGQIFAAGLGHCGGAAGDSALKKYDITSGKWSEFGRWRPEPGEKIGTLAVSPSGGRLALSKSDKAGLAEWIILDGITGDVLFRRAAPNQDPNASIQLPDDETLVQTGADQNGIWRFGSGSWRAMPDYARDAVVASDGQMLAVGAKDEDFILIYDPLTGQKTTSVEFGGVLKSGFIPQKALFWAMSATDGLRFWSSKDWTTLFSIPFFYPSGLFAIDPEGRYDSTFGDEPDFLLRWLASDDPYLPLGFQTFFRDFYEPGLVGRI